MTDTRPNVLWICTDQQRYDTLGCYGNEFVETPNVDGLADDGVRFSRAFAQNPICSPSRASFLTGRYPRTTGVRQNGQPIPEREVPVTKLLADAGYVCGLSGKLHLSPANPNYPTSQPPMMERRIDDGYAEFHWSHGPDDNWPTNEYQHWLREKDVPFERETHPDSEHVEYGMAPEHHQTTWCAQQAINFVEDAADFDRPWLFSVNVYDPHHKFDPPREYLERYEDRLGDVPLPDFEPGELDDKPAWFRSCHEGAYNNPNFYPYTEMDETDHRLVRAAYWAMVDQIDDQVGRLLDALDRTGQREDTLVIFTSDHGELLGDHGIYLKGPFFYEPSLRLPLVFSWPDRFREGATSDALVELVDLAPTLLDAAGVDVPRRMQGRSLHPMLAGDDPLDHHRDAVYAESYDAVHWQAEPPARATMVRTDRYKLVRHHGLDSGELYDLDADPGEHDDRWDDPAYADVRRDLTETLSDRMAATADPIPERQAPW